VAMIGNKMDTREKERERERERGENVAKMEGFCVNGFFECNFFFLFLFNLRGSFIIQL
jgi:hypothetical protein